MSESRLLLQRVGLVGVSYFLVNLSSLILLPILTKTLPIKQYGFWVQISVTTSLLPYCALLGLQYSMVRFLAPLVDKARIREGFYTMAATSLIGSAVVSFLVFLLLYEGGSFSAYKSSALVISLIILFASANTLFESYFNALQQMKKFSIFSVLQAYVAVLFIAYFTLRTHSVYYALIGTLIAQVVIFVAMLCMIFSQIGIAVPKFAQIKDYLAFGVPTVPQNLANWVVNSSDRYVVGFFIGTAAVGYYNPGYSLGNLLLTLTVPTSLLLPPLLSKHYDGHNHQAVATILKHALKYSLAVAIPLAFFVSILSRSILTILTTPEIAAEGYLVTPFVAVGALLMVAYANVYVIILLVKKTKTTAMIWILAAALNLGLNLFLVPVVGIIGAALTTMLAFAFAFAITLHYARKSFKFDFDFSFLLKSLACSSFASLILIKFQPVTIIGLIIIFGIFVVIYVAILLLLRGITRDELAFFAHFYKIEL